MSGAGAPDPYLSAVHPRLLVQQLPFAPWQRKAERCQELRLIVTDYPALAAPFKTPGLRKVALRAPYLHAEQFASLEQVVNHDEAGRRPA